MSKVFFVDTPDELRLALAEDMIREGEDMVANAELQEKRRALNPKERSLRTKAENATHLRFGQYLRTQGYFLRDQTIVRPRSEDPFATVGRS